MAVVLDAVGTEKYTAPGTSASYTTLTVGTGANRALVLTVVFGYGGSAPTGVSATWDSGGTNQSMTLVQSVDYTGGSVSVYIFGLVAPTSGNKTLALSWTNSAETFQAAISFTGVDQTGGTTSFPHATFDPMASVSLPITSAVGNYVMYGASPAAGTLSGTVIFNDTSSGAFINAAVAYAVGASTVTVSGGTYHGIAGTDIQAGASPPPVAPFMTAGAPLVFM